MTKSTNNDSDTVAESPVSVLIVDNDKHHAQAMAEILERTGYPCKMATSGPEGAKRIDQ